jgi:preprotein translocase subunit SecG
MLMLILNVVYVLLAIGMVALILMQRGAGAQAGSGFGGGASATVFGSRGASNFLSKSTKWMAITFFVISLFMAWYATHSAAPVASQQDLGVMAQVPASPAGIPASGNSAGAIPNALVAPTLPGAPVQQSLPGSTIPAAPIPVKQPAAVPTIPSQAPVKPASGG